MTRAIKFAHAYFADPHGVRAARAAGYAGSEESLRRTASRTLKRTDVQAELARLAQRSGARAVAKRDQALAVLTAQLLFDPGPYLTIDEDGEPKWDHSALKRDGKAGLETMTIGDRQKAAILLARFEGWFAPKEHTHTVAHQDLARLSDVELQERAKKLGLKV